MRRSTSPRTMPRGHSRLLAGTGFLVVLLCIVIAPGPKYEEGVLLLVMGLALSACALLATLFDPRPVFNPVIFPALWLFGCTGVWWRIALEYDYQFLDLTPLLVPAKLAGVGIVVLCVSNLAARRLSAVWKLQKGRARANT